GKTGTAQVNYGAGKESMYYSSSFAGYFPAENPKYSCIVVIHKPSVSKGYYGADVSGPVFKRIAQKIFTDVPSTNKVKTLDTKLKKQEELYASYYTKEEQKLTAIPNMVGMSGMDAVALLGNMGLKVQVIGAGKVKKQSLQPGQAFRRQQTITLELL
ncbi:penicillin-binding protein, partial [Nostoc linckia z15]